MSARAWGRASFSGALFFAASLGAPLVVAGCGASSGARPAEVIGSPLSRYLAPDEVLPRDLDWVVHVDIERVRTALGGDEQAALTESLATDPLTRRGVAGARGIWLGLRGDSLAVGDRVLVAVGYEESDGELAAQGFLEQASSNDKVRIFVRPEETNRAAPACVLLLVGTATVYVSSAEVDAVLRVLVAGPDEDRGSPNADGIVSADLRPKRLPEELAKRFPHAAELVAGTDRLRGRLNVLGAELQVILEITARGEAESTRVARFLEALRDGAHDTGTSRFLKTLEIEQTGEIVHAKLTLTPSDLAMFLPKPDPGE